MKHFFITLLLPAAAAAAADDDDDDDDDDTEELTTMASRLHDNYCVVNQSTSNDSKIEEQGKQE